MGSGQADGPEQLDFVLQIDAETLAHAAPGQRDQRGDIRRAGLAEFSMKFACTLEMHAPPMTWPLRPQASISAPAPGPSSGFLKTDPNVRALRGWLSLRRALHLAHAGADLLADAGSSSQHGLGTTSRAHVGVPVAQLELAGPPLPQPPAETTSA